MGSLDSGFGVRISPEVRVDKSQCSKGELGTAGWLFLGSQSLRVWVQMTSVTLTPLSCRLWYMRPQVFRGRAGK